MHPHPLISCICVTRKRVHLLSRAIQCFLHQTYINKELIIVFEDDDTETLAFSKEASKQYQNVKWYPVKRAPDKHLGALRNEAISFASGVYICQWDDDDWYHPERLSFQFSELQQSQKEACVLGYEIIFDALHQQSYLSCLRFWEGTVLCSKDITMKYSYRNIEKGEDTPFITTLQQYALVYLSQKITPFYIYVYHGKNTWDYHHFKTFFPYCKKLPTPINDVIIKLLDCNHFDPENVDLLSRLFSEAYKPEYEKSDTSNYSPVSKG